MSRPRHPRTGRTEPDAPLSLTQWQSNDYALLTQELTTARERQTVSESAGDPLIVLKSFGLMDATCANRLGGPGLGGDAASTERLLWLLAAVGEADLSLACVLEQHLSAIMFIQENGSPRQHTKLQTDLTDGKVLGTWDIDDPDNPVRLSDGRLSGSKLFAIGAGRITMPLVIARDEAGRTRTLLLPNDRMSYWINPQHSRLVGIVDAVSHAVVIADVSVDEAHEIGAPDSWISQPQAARRLLRQCAVRVGALRALLLETRMHVQNTGDDPFQKQRLAEMVLDVEGAFAWLERASAVPFLKAANGEDIAAFMQTAQTAIERAIDRTVQVAQHALGSVAAMSGGRAANIILDLLSGTHLFLEDEALGNVGEAALADRITVGRFIEVFEPGTAAD